MVLSLDTVNELMDQGELNKAIEEAEQYLDKCIEASALRKGYVDVSVYENLSQATTYSRQPDIELKYIIKRHNLSNSHVALFRTKLVEAYAEAGYKVDYELHDMGMSEVYFGIHIQHYQEVEE